MALALVAMLCSALVTEAIGVHAIFGAFLLGAVIPHDSRLARVLEERIEYLVTILLLPAFFAFTGMRTEIGLLSGWSAWLTCGGDHRRRDGGQVRRGAVRCPDGASWTGRCRRAWRSS